MVIVNEDLKSLHKFKKQVGVKQVVLKWMKDEYGCKQLMRKYEVQMNSDYSVSFIVIVL